MSVENDLMNTTILMDVYSLLKKYPSLRDNDRVLWLAYCVQHKGLRKILGKEYYNLFKNWLLSDNIPTFESLSRARRKVQEKYEDTRGDSYKIKHHSAKVISQWSQNENI